MPARDPLWRRYLRFLGPDPVADVDDELRFHLEELERKFRAGGMEPEAARRAARAQFGNVEHTRHTLRSHSARTQRRTARVERWQGLVQDVRVSARKLIAQPGFTLAAVLTLALGIGANAAVFSVVNAALLRPLPYPHADRIVSPQTYWRGAPFAASPPDFVDYAAQTHSFTGVAAMETTTLTLTGHGDPQPIGAAMVTQAFFDVMGVQPAKGSPFSASEETYGQTTAAIVSDGLWRGAFGARDDIVGQTVQLDGATYHIVGVMPRGFDFPSGRRLWVPLAFSDTDLATQRGAHYLDLVARLKPGVTVAAAAQDVSDLAARLAIQYPKSSKGFTGTVTSLRDSLVGSSPRHALIVLLAAVALVALIACANVANLLLARGAMRGREMAVRTALGARPRDLIGMALVESVMLAMAGGVVGIGVAVAATRALDGLRPAALRQLGTAHVDLTVLAFTFGLSVVTGLLFGIAPAVQAASAANLHGVLQEGGRAGMVGKAGWRARGALVAAEMAIAVILVAGAGLLIKSFAQLESVDPGFTPAGVTAFDLSLPSSRYPTPAQSAQFYARLVDQVGALPGVTSAAGMTGLPLDNYGYSISMHSLDGLEIPSEEQPSTQIRIATPGAFATLGARMIAGRDFTSADRDGAPYVVVVNQAAAKLLWKGVNPIGHDVVIGTSMGLGRGRVGGTVVGVVSDMHDASLGRPGRPTIYLPHAQVPLGDLEIIARTRAGVDATQLVAGVRARVRELDADLPLLDARSLSSVAALSVDEPRFAALLLGVFAALALILAAVGIFGVMAYVVGQRTREIGVRMALGADGPRVIGETLRRAMAPVAIGVAVGTVGALVLTQSMTKMLYDVRPSDPATLAMAAIALAAVAFVAAWLPARRASRVDPLIALRAE